MSILTRCRACRGKEFLGVECAWPANYCISAHDARRDRRLRWSLRLIAATLTVAIVAAAWQFFG